jgi:hypothetical protein
MRQNQSARSTPTAPSAGWRLILMSGLILVEFIAKGIAADSPTVSAAPQATNDFALVQSGNAATIVYDAADAKVVQIAAELFADDVQRVTGVLPAVTNSLPGAPGRIVLIGTIGHDSNLDALITAGKLNVDSISGGWERYQAEVVENPFPGVSRALVIAGSDRRGTAFGVFSLSEAMGVSPWYWWADVPPQTKPEIFVNADRFISKEPSVRYRGIFLNDEDWGLQEWAEKNFESGANDVKDIGPKTYAKVFELLLRLKANFVWPAMHPSTAAFNAYASNKVVADDYAIVMGSSHAEPMLRNNVYEWSRFVDPVTGASYSDSDWNYSINRDGVYRYWEQRVMANGVYENVYTLGKRGIHDSGMVEGSNNTEKAAWLNTIFTDQRQILTNHVNPDATKIPQIFVPYKEVLDIYDTGLVNVPSDVTLVWPDDNHGYIRRLSDPNEQQRPGGGGVYYHISYWGSPADYLWLCSTPPSLIWEELTKAYDYNCGRLWVINVGDIKPAEICLEFAMRLAWNVNRYDENAQADWLTEWAAREFGTAYAPEIAAVLNEYYRLGYARKPEHMSWVDADALSPAGPYPLFSHVHFGDEASKRLADYASLTNRAQAVYDALPSSKRSAFFETVLYPIRGADGMNRKFLNAGRAQMASIQGRNTVASHSSASQQGYNDIQTDTLTYNQVIEAGKWNEMMDAKPRSLAVFNQATLPAVPALTAGLLGVAIEGRAEPALLTSTGVVFKPLPGFINLNAVTDGILTAPMIATNIAGKLATWTPGTGGNYAAGAGGWATYSFTVAVATNYALWFEINCPTVNDDSWFIKMDNGTAAAWNNLSNGGVWGWVQFGTFTLSAGQHTLTVYEREDGAAMANIKLTSTATVLVEDRSQSSFQLPEFNRFTRGSNFVDLFNTGTGTLNWQVTTAAPWLRVSETSGALNSETRLWVSVDWASAPQSEALSSSLTISNNGQSLVIPVQVWDPPMQLPFSVKFVEDNQAVAIEAEHFSTPKPGSDCSWRTLPNLGSGDGVMRVSPVTAASRTNITEITNTSPVLEYNVYLRSTGTVSIVSRFIPTLPINNSRGLRYAVNLDNETPQIVDMNRTSGSGSVWSRSVLRSAIDYSTSHRVTYPGEHTLKVWMVDPGVVLDRIMIATGMLPYSYGGPEETPVRSFGAMTITNGQTLVLQTNQSLNCDSLTNDGTLTLLGSALLNISGAFINNGTLDIMTWQGTLPPGLVNNGIILDRSAIRIEQVSMINSDLHILIHGYPGHGYQLQEAFGGNLSASWINVGGAITGTNMPVVFVTDVLSNRQGFFRVTVSP